jgi:hypothetical protein
MDGCAAEFGSVMDVVTGERNIRRWNLHSRPMKIKLPPQHLMRMDDNKFHLILYNNPELKHADEHALPTVMNLYASNTIYANVE